MKTILVDDERLMLDLFEEESKGISEIEITGRFDDPEDALAFAREERVDLAFLDIEMPKMDGLELSDCLRELYPDIIIIFVSAYEHHMRSAMKEHDADWFLLKPYTTDEVKRVLERAKLLSMRQKKRVEIRTFGNFEVYVDGNALQFTSLRAKEILAILVDRCGDSMSSESMFYEMWPEEEYTHAKAGKFRHAMQRLQRTLIEAGVDNILEYFPHARALKCDMVECDYFDFLKGDKEALRRYRGSYMHQFSWGESRTPLLNSMKLRSMPDSEDELYDE